MGEATTLFEAWVLTFALMLVLTWPQVLDRAGLQVTGGGPGAGHTGWVNTSALPPASPDLPTLPPGLTVFERGWLSSNNILFVDDDRAALVDTGYCTHADQTLALVGHALADRALDDVLNTHLHSDHCGGNAALQTRYPAVVTAIPPGLAQAVTEWNEDLLGHSAFGQAIVRYRFDRLLQPGSTERLAGRDWQVHAAPGHDNDAVLLFEPASRTLISADALWQNGFGVVFPELGGGSGYSEVADTLDLIEKLAPATVIPGHGPVFTQVAEALAVARKRLDGFVQQPERHTRHAAKVLIKYKLLELGRTTHADLHAWAQATPMLAVLHDMLRPANQTPDDFSPWVNDVLADLARSGAVGVEGDAVFNR
jgi:glyoxylase-like metal-dependent hydrolase (beta-lactamase superfamily II)